jgi:hypothetical protein
MRVHRSDWKSEPMPSSFRLQYPRSLAKRDVEGLLAGFKPRGMDDKWFFFAEENVVHLHRSWSGEEIYSLQLLPRADGGADITEVLVNSEYPDRDDAAQVLDLLIDRILPQYYGDE